MWKLLYILLFFQFAGSVILHAQETNSLASGRVSSEDDEKLVGVTVTLIHEPTQNKYVSVTRSDGYFHFFNLKPGGPYTIVFSSVGYETLKRANLFIHLSGEYFFAGNNGIADFLIQKKMVTIDGVVIDAGNNGRLRNGIETNITTSTMQSMPAISRNFQDFVRLVPQAKVTGDGVMSLAGQNNRFNAFFIDGANNNDLQGLAVSGTNGGLTGSPSVSVEAIEEINVLLAPYDVQYGNFTGGSINVITRSGSNENKSSAWYYFRNENLAGRSPQSLEKPGSPGEFYRPRLSDFFNQIFGVWNSGALIRNRLFYFALVERQSELSPQPFNLKEYQGNSKEEQLFALSDFLKTTYQYDPGSFLETKDDLDATRLLIKMDWNASVKDKLTISYRYNNAERMKPRAQSSATSVVFENNGIILPAKTHAASFEWKRNFKGNMNNRLLISFTSQAEDRKWIGQPFPNVSILDGSRHTIVLGSESNTGVYETKAKDFSLFDVFKYVEKRHILTIGTDINYSTIDNVYFPGSFGIYQFQSVNDFMSGAFPFKFQLSFFFEDEPAYPTKFHNLRTSLFINDELRAIGNLKLNFGLRLDVNSILSSPGEDKFFNDSAIGIISRHYDLEGATSGKTIRPHWAFSPRIGVDHKFPKLGMNLRGGAGIFLGRIVNIWTSDKFNSAYGRMDLDPPALRFTF